MFNLIISQHLKSYVGLAVCEIEPALYWASEVLNSLSE